MPTDPTLTPTLKQGSKGPDVTRLQTALVALGHPLTLDGDFGPKTKAAVIAFQRAAALTPSGAVTMKVWAALAKAAPAEMPWTDAAAEPEQPAESAAPAVEEEASAPAAEPATLAPTAAPEAPDASADGESAGGNPIDERVEMLTEIATRGYGTPSEDLDLRAEITEPVDPLAYAGELAVAEAERLWALNIYDPPNSMPSHTASRAQIDRMIRSVDGLGWTWQTPYKKDRDYEWCGAFVMTCWAKAGLALKPHRYTFGSSTFRLERWARYQPFEGVSSGPRPAVAPRMRIKFHKDSKPAEARFEDGSLPRAGDIVIVGDTDLEHITLCTSFDPTTGVFQTIEGNAGSSRSGLAPDGTRRQGVIKTTRKIGGAGYRVLLVIRPSLSDLVIRPSLSDLV